MFLHSCLNNFPNNSLFCFFLNMQNKVLKYILYFESVQLLYADCSILFTYDFALCIDVQRVGQCVSSSL